MGCCCSQLPDTDEVIAAKQSLEKCRAALNGPDNCAAAWTAVAAAHKEVLSALSAYCSGVDSTLK